MAKLSTKARNALPDKEFAGPDRSFPVNDASHAGNAKSRAKEMLDRGRISQSEYDQICTMADAKLHDGDKDGM